MRRTRDFLPATADTMIFNAIGVADRFGARVVSDTARLKILAASTDSQDSRGGSR